MIARGAGVAMVVAVLSTGSACGDDSGSSESGGSTGTSGGASTSDTTSGPSTSDTATTSTTTSVDTSGSTGPSDTSTTTVDTDTGTDTGGGVPTALVTIDDAANPARLLRVDVATGSASEVCTLPAGSYPTITFARDDTLYALDAGQNRIETIDPCTCGFQIVGPTATGPLEITADARDGLVAVDLDLDAFSTVNPQTGLASVVGPVGLELDATAIGWSDALGGVYLVNPTTDELHTIDPSIGAATPIAALSEDVITAGMDVLAATGELYMCAGDILYTVDPDSGTMTEVGPLGEAIECDTLAAPWAPISCLE